MKRCKICKRPIASFDVKDKDKCFDCWIKGKKIKRVNKK